MKLYIDKETGGIYRINELGNVEMREATGLITDDEEDWYEMNPWDELIPHEGKEYQPMEFEKIIRAKLTE